MHHSTLLAPVLLAAACTAGPDGADADVPTTPVTLRFAAAFGEAPAACGDTFAAPLGSTTVALLDLRFFVSELDLLRADGTADRVRFDDDGAWQHPEVALIDLEDGSAGCAASGNAATHADATGEVTEAEHVGVAFTLGVPDALNHLDTTSAPPPLDLASMGWSWQAGHKHVRIELSNDRDPPDDKWFFHVGASGCVSDGATQPPATACSRPNRARVTLPEFDPAAASITLDMGALLAGVDIGSDTEGSPIGCMSSPTDAAECTPIFANLGLDFATGACVDGCAGQTAFVAR